MRVLGAVLLVAGVLLCVSIVWAALGFFMRGAGLIFLLVAEERSKRLERAISSYPDRSNIRQDPVMRSEPTAVSGSLEAAGEVDPRRSQDHRTHALRALYEAVADNGAIMGAAAPTDRDSRLARSSSFWPDKDVGPTA
jgi:hypothetical protein